MSIDLATAQREGYVVGLKAESGVVPRREIDDLMVNDSDCFNLFILALERIMKDEGGKQDKMNYFQIAGIHGLPLINWDGVQIPGLKKAGSYCNHASFLFPSWHRPYLAMMEQTLYSSMKDIAAKFEDAKYTEAAKRFRLPFWDWIKPRGQRQTPFPGVGRDGRPQVGFAWNYDLPAVVQMPTLKVFTPESQKKLVDINNPLANYTFPKTGSLSDSAWGSLEDRDDATNEDRRRKAEQARREGRPSRFVPKVHASHKRTVRTPASDFSEQDDFDRVNKSLNMMRESSSENALNMILLKDYNKYLDFAAEVEGVSAGTPFGSLEDIHNTYHGLIGNDGHMGRVPVAAFDPIFWLHHCNIDRILTIWQATHSGPESYLPPKNRDFGPEIPLWPFRKGAKQTFWNSTDVQDHKVFGYTYADVSDVSKTGAPALSVRDVQNRWFQSYDWSLQSNSKTTPPKWMMPPAVQKAQALNFTGGVESAMPTFTTMSTVLSQKVQSVKVAAQEAIGISSSEKMETAPELEKNTLEPVEQAAAPAPVILDSQVPQVHALLKQDAQALPIIQYYVDVKVQRDAFDGAFTIFYFIAMPSDMVEVDADPSNWPIAHVLAGTTHVFTAPRQACDACNLHSEQGTIVTGTSPITPMLRDYVLNAGLLEGLAPEQVVPFLKKNLYWRVKAINNITVDPEEMPFLKVGVSSVMSAQREDEGVPVVSQTASYPEVTEGRRGGNPVAQLSEQFRVNT